MTTYREKKRIRIANRNNAIVPKNVNETVTSQNDNFAFQKYCDKLMSKSVHSLKALEFVDKLLIFGVTIDNAIAQKQLHFSNVTDKANYCLSFKNVSQFKNHIVNRQKQNFVFDVQNDSYKLVAIKKTK